MEALSELLATTYHTEPNASSSFEFHTPAEGSPSPWEQLTELKLSAAGPTCSCALLGLAAAVPLLENSLPRDKEGICFVPHQHPMQLTRIPPGTLSRWNGLTNKYDYFTQRICDRCMANIEDIDFYHCGGGCDVDFCNKCQRQIEENMQQFLGREAKSPAEARTRLEQAVHRMLWAVHTLDHLARQILVQSAEQRRALAQQLAAEWPEDLFRRLVKVVADVCNGRILFNCNHGALSTAAKVDPKSPAGRRTFIQEVLPLYAEPRFWYSIGLLQFLVACNELPRPELAQSEIRFKIAESEFILQGMNKCHDGIEWKTWKAAPYTLAPFAVLRTPQFVCDAHFASLVIHHNLLPLTFRLNCLLRNCLEDKTIEQLRLEVSRDPAELVQDVVQGLLRKNADGTRSKNMLVGLDASFKGEIAHGPGVVRDFLQCSLRAFLSKLFAPTENRSFWFKPDPDEAEALDDCFFACGALMALALLHRNFIPRVFPETLFYLLLNHVGSPFAAEFDLPQLADVSPQEARSLQQVLDYTEDDIGDLFGDLGWERTGDLRPLTQDSKKDLVHSYVKWSLTTKIEAQFAPFASGFEAVLGAPVMLRQMITAAQLQSILCSTECEVNVPALRAASLPQDWGPNDQEYLDGFWQIVESFPEPTKEQFLIFVTASSQAPLAGWKDLHLVVKHNGVGDERFPAAYTCFNLILLPKYSSLEVLRQRLLSAIHESSGFGLK